MDKRVIISIYMLLLFSCDDILCRFNKVPEAPYPDPDRVEEFKTSSINQITYVYECLDNEKYPKQFVAITYTIEKTYDPDNNNNNTSCWSESIYVNLGNC